MPTSTHLDRFAADLAHQVRRGATGPSIVAVPPVGPARTVPLEGRHPLEVLWQLGDGTAWDGLVVVATGRVVAGGHERAAPAVAGAPVVVATVVGRQGPDRSLVLDGAGRPVLARADVEGLVPDAARRVLGRATAPPGRPVTGWWAGEWLFELARELGAGASPAGLHAVAALHPAVDGDELPAATADVVAFLVERGLDHAHLTGWEGVRASVARGLLVDPWCPAELAGWYDAGSFSRYVEAARPPAGAMLDWLRPSLDPEVGAAMARVLVAWGCGPSW